MRRMICDIPNLFFRGVAGSRASMENMPEEEAKAYALHICLMSLRKHFNNIKPQELAVVFEGGNNWRKAYTRSEQCYSKRIYKANRVPDPSMAILFPVLEDFKQMCKTLTSIVVINKEQLEGDDCISGYINFHPNDEIVILSGDKDFVQLLKHDNVILINPDNAEERTVMSVCGVDDPDYFMFEKCFRGDIGDNVISALPRVRATKLQKAWGINNEPPDLILLNKLLSQTWELPSSDENGGSRVMEVGKLFDENQKLMCLESQPDEIKELITKAVEEAYETRGKYNHVGMIKFLGKRKLDAICADIDSFVGMFSNTQYKNVLTEGSKISNFGKNKEVKIKGITF